MILPLATLPVAAQDAGIQAAPKAAAPAVSADGDDALATVTVTALFRSTELQSTPLAISAVTGDQLAQRSVHDVADLNNLWREMNAEERGQTDDSDNVLNGIAYDAKTGRFYLTGKRWKVIFPGKFVEADR